MKLKFLKTTKLNFLFSLFLSIVGVLSILTLFAIPPAYAKAVSPTVDAQNGFPIWYSDDNNIQVMPCLDGADANCVLPGVGEEPNFDPAQSTVFPNNFPSEFFYWIAESDQLTTPKGGKVFMRFAVEGAFENDNPIAGDQVTFGRVRITGTDLEPNSSYIATHPYGRTIYRTNEIGIFPRNTSTEDMACAPVPGFPCNFSIALVSRVFGGFLQWNSGAPAGYLGDAVTPHAVTGSPTGNNFFKIEGPGLPTGGLQTNLFVVSGKLFTAPVPCTNTAPDATLLNIPANGSTNISASPTLSWNSIAGFGTNCAGNNNQFEVFLDTGNVIPTTSKGIVPSSQTSLNITGLIPSTTYSWKIRANNGALSTDSSIFTFTTGALACTNTAPDQPTLANPASGATNIAINPTLSWNAVAGFGTNCTGNNNQFQILLDQGNVNPSTLRGTVSTAQTSFAGLTLNFSATYSWKVRATNGNLTTDSAVRTFTTVAPPAPPTAPSSLRATSVSGGIRLNWIDRSNNETEFRIERRLGLTGSFTQINTASQNTTIFIDTTAPSGILGYRIKACNLGVCSAYSNTALTIKR